MMKIKCEMCGSSDMIKEDSLYICQYCGMKYSPEEAKKMMVEIEGAVKIDASEEIANLYLLARRAKNNEDLAEALKYYRAILLKDPMSWEAVFFSLIFDHTQRPLAELEQSCFKILNGISSAITLVNETIKNDEERKRVYDDMVKYTVWATRNIASAGQNRVFEKRRCEILKYLHNILYTFANELQCLPPKGAYYDAVISCIKQGLLFQSMKINDYPSFNNENERKRYFELADYVKRYDKAYVIPEIPALTAEQIEKERLQREKERLQREKEAELIKEKEAELIREKEIESNKEKRKELTGMIMMICVFIVIAVLAIIYGPSIIGWLISLILDLIFGGLDYILGV